jgi:hypothetical protein
MKKSAKPKETHGSRRERHVELLELREGELNDAFSRVFTLEVDDRPTLAFEANRTERPKRSARDRGFGMI